jgi:phosphohistidine phosphatase SixA
MTEWRFTLDDIHYIIMKTIVFARHGLAAAKGPHVDDWSRMTLPAGDAKTRTYAMALQKVL